MKKRLLIAYHWGMQQLLARAGYYGKKIYTLTDDPQYSHWRKYSSLKRQL